MGLGRWFTHNVAATDPPTHNDLQPLVLDLPADDAWKVILATVPAMPRWRIVRADPATGCIQATRHTRVFRFVDDVLIRVEPLVEGTRVGARSQSRLGKGDLGQNRRNLIELLQAIRRAIKPS
jgi:uncharacterized protein (DUF1499 family)